MSKQALNNPQKSVVISHGKESAVISESSLLVPLAKSKKLAALRKQSQVLQRIEKNPLQGDEKSMTFVLVPKLQLGNYKQEAPAS